MQSPSAGYNSETLFFSLYSVRVLVRPLWTLGFITESSFSFTFDGKESSSMEGQVKVVQQSTIKDNPWGVFPAINPEPCSLSVLMDEELARELDEEERSKETPVEPVEQNLTLDDSVASDFLLAQMLQYEFDRENDKYVAAREKHVNGNSKGS